ncbi:MAG: deoxyribose-phosphate aldolase [Treponema sp.]
MTKSEMAKMIDHTLLNACAQTEDIKRLCSEAKNNSFASVCINPCYIQYAAEQLKDSCVKVCTVIGFPLGADTAESKAFAAKDAVEKGADEIDMVINISEVKNGNFDIVESDIKAVVDESKKCAASKGKEAVVKVILETCYLTDDEIVKSCNAAKNAGADFVKTSTGFATPKGIDGSALPNGASVHHVALMKKTVGDSMKVKAAGGIRSLRTALDLAAAGADRIGTSSGLMIIQGLKD